MQWDLMLCVATRMLSACVCSPIGGEGDESMAAGVGDSTTVGDGGSVEAGGGDALMCCVG